MASFPSEFFTVQLSNIKKWQGFGWQINVRIQDNKVAIASPDLELFLPFSERNLKKGKWRSVVG